MPPPRPAPAPSPGPGIHSCQRWPSRTQLLQSRPQPSLGLTRGPQQQPGHRPTALAQTPRNRDFLTPASSLSGQLGQGQNHPRSEPLAEAGRWTPCPSLLLHSPPPTPTLPFFPPFPDSGRPRAVNSETENRLGDCAENACIKSGPVQGSQRPSKAQRRAQQAWLCRAGGK